MTDQPYTDEDLRIVAAKYLGDDWDSLSIREDLKEPDPWSSLDEDTFKTALRKIVDLATKAADLSAWAVALAADGLEASPDEINLDNANGPFLRLHFAFHPDMAIEDRHRFAAGVQIAVANHI